MKIGFDQIFPINSTSSPFSMDIIDFTNNQGLVECVRFKSDLCRMCYKRNTELSRPLEMWTRCYHILPYVDTYCIFDGILYEGSPYYMYDKTMYCWKWKKYMYDCNINPSNGNHYQQYFRICENDV